MRTHNPRFSCTGCRLLMACTLLGLMCLSGCKHPPRDVIKIGLVAPFEGDLRYLGYDAIYAARLAIREINSVGGIQGIPVELVAYDDRASLDMALDAVRNLAVDPQVLVVIGHYYDVSPQIYALYEHYQLPLIEINSPPSSVPRVYANVYHLAPAPAAFYTAWMDRVPANEMAVLWTDPGIPLPDAFILSTQAAGVSWVHSQASPDSEISYPFAFNWLDSLDAFARNAEWRQRGWQGTVIGGAELLDAESGDPQGDKLDHICALTSFPRPQDVPDRESWIEDYMSVGPHVPAPGPMALVTYETVMSIAKALDGQGAFDRQSTTTALQSMQFTGELDYGAWDKTHYLNAMPLYVYCWHKGALTLQREIIPGQPDD